MESIESMTLQEAARQIVPMLFIILLPIVLYLGFIVVGIASIMVSSFLNRIRALFPGEPGNDSELDDTATDATPADETDESVREAGR